VGLAWGTGGMGGGVMGIGEGAMSMGLIFMGHRRRNGIFRSI
jgi:hypothetical protein